MTHNDLWKYDPLLDTWTQVASLPGSTRKNAIAFVVNDFGYVGTGFDSNETAAGQKLKDLWRYDPILNDWEEKAHYPGGGDTGIYQASSFAIGSKGYVVCGKIGSDAYIYELWEYDTELDLWTQRTPFPGGDRYQMVAFSLQNKGYAGLGTDHDVRRKDFWQYDPIDNVWYAKANFPGSERAQSSTFTINSKGFVVFGSDGGDKDELWEYSHFTDSWNIKAPFPGGGRKNGIAFSIGEIGYVGMGKSTAEGKKRSFYAYYPAGPLTIQNNELDDLSIYPNPFKTYTTIQIPDILQGGTITLKSIAGQTLFVWKGIEEIFTLQRENLPNGVYWIEIQSKSAELNITKKIVLI
jgi:N-acetylneuraminic acid mutarotase